MNIKGFLTNAFGGGSGAGRISPSKSGITAPKKEAAPQPSLLDNVTISSKPEIPYKTERVVSKKNLLQNEGVIQESKVFKEETKPDFEKVEPGTTFADPKITSKTTGKEVRLKSGVVISSETDGHSVKLYQKNGDGNLKCMAVMDNTELDLPKETNTPLYSMMNGLFGNTMTKPGETAIRNSEMKQIISPNGTITLIDEKRGALEDKTKPFSGPQNNYLGLPPGPMIGSGALLGLASGLLNQWHGDTYVITPDGKVTGTQYTPKSINITGEKISIPGTAQAIKVTGEQLPDGTIKVSKNGKDIYYKPFISSKHVNQGFEEK